MDTAGDSVENPGLMTTASGIGIQHGFGVCEGTLLSAIRFAAFPFSLFIIIESFGCFRFGPCKFAFGSGAFQFMGSSFFSALYYFVLLLLWLNNYFEFLVPDFGGGRRT